MLNLGSHIYLFKDALSLDQCERLISQFEASPKKGPGTVDGPNGPMEHPNKKSIDLKFDENDVETNFMFFMSASKMVSQIADKHYELNQGKIKDTGITIQKSRPGDYFKAHIDGCFGVTARRQLAIIWYLNDVNQGGETYFEHQDIWVRPRAGRAIVFPPFWTHRHEGMTPKTDKYIATTFAIS